MRAATILAASAALVIAGSGAALADPGSSPGDAASTVATTQDAVPTQVTASALQAATGDNPVDPTQVGSALDTQAAGASISAPVDPASPLTYTAGGDSVQIQLPAAPSQADAQVANDGTIVYNGPGNQTDLAVQTTDDGLRLATIIQDSSAPTRYDFGLSLPDGGSLQLMEDGGAVILDANGQPTTTVDAPWATDANGTPVPTHFEVQGSTLTQVVDHSDAFTYPITADPMIRHWWGVELRMSNLTVTRISNLLNAGAGAAAIAAALAAGGVISSPGAVPSAIVSGVLWFGSGALSVCNWNGRGISLNVTYTGQTWCWPR
jgi:hypothetical protein